MSRSSHRPARTADSTPSGMPTSALMAMAASASSTEAGQNARRSSIPGLRVTSSFGLSSVEFGAPSLKSLIEEADQALYAAKQAGRNKVVRFDEMPPQVRQAALAG